MKVLSSILLLLLICKNEQAQEQGSKLSAISLAVVLPHNSDRLSADQLSKLESKITSLVAESGLAASDYSQNFVIYPKFEIYNTQESRGGMRNIVVTDCSLSLFIKQVNTNNIFSSYTKKIQGSGFTREESIANALSQIDPGDEAAATFIKKAKEKIISYYNQNCDVILQKAERERVQKKYESALSVLLTIPEEAQGCFTKAQSKIQAVFKESQTYMCKQYLQKAKASAASNYYDDALRYLSWIDPTVNCGSEAKTLLNSISKEVDADKKKEWDLVFKAYDGAIEVEKARAQAMNSMASYWLTQHSSAVTYDIIIR